MVTTIAGAAMRAFLVWVFVLTPALLMQGGPSDGSLVVVFFAVLAAIFTFAEYYSNYPSIVEFRFAAPLNRLRFGTAFLTVALLAIVCKEQSTPTALSALVTDWGARLGAFMDVPYSPVRLAVLMLPPDASADLVQTLRIAAGLSYAICFAALAVFFGLVRFAKWPSRNGVFNVWLNLPLFDPTGGGDVLVRLKRDANLNILFGFLLPFIIPALVKAATDVAGAFALSDPHTLIWTITAWAFLPSSLIMRGIAMGRIAEMIGEKRRRAYAQSEAAQAA